MKQNRGQRGAAGAQRISNKAVGTIFTDPPGFSALSGVTGMGGVVEGGVHVVEIQVTSTNTAQQRVGCKHLSVGFRGHVLRDDKQASHERQTMRLGRLEPRRAARERR